MKERWFNRGQSVLEYAILFSIIIAVILLMGYYIRNSLMGKIRDGADTLGGGEVYVPSVEGVSNPTIVNEQVN
jgi:hypothetical protein